MTPEEKQRLKNARCEAAIRFLVPSSKEQFNCSEIHLAHKRLRSLHYFDALPNLEVLWLNNNLLKRIQGLDANFRLRNLYLHENQLMTLEGSLKHLRFLETLSLADNQLRDLHVTLPYLTHLIHLKTLDLFGNPLAQETNYRLHVLHQIPSLQVLDRHEITQEEREKARLLFVGSVTTTIAFGRRKPVWVKEPKQGILDLSPCVEDMYNELERLNERWQLESELAEQRSFGLITDAEMQARLRPRKSHSPPSRFKRPSKDVFSLIHFADERTQASVDAENAKHSVPKRRVSALQGSSLAGSPSASARLRETQASALSARSGTAAAAAAAAAATPTSSQPQAPRKASVAPGNAQQSSESVGAEAVEGAAAAAALAASGTGRRRSTMCRRLSATAPPSLLQHGGGGGGGGGGGESLVFDAANYSLYEKRKANALAGVKSMSQFQRRTLYL